MNPDVLILAAVALAVALGLGVVTLILRHLARRRRERLAPAFELGTCRGVGPLGTVVEGVYRGYTCRYAVQHASQYNPGGASIRLAAASAVRWSAQVADVGSRLMVKVGLLKDVEVGADEFDQRLRFTAEDEGALRSLVGTEAMRTALGALLASPNFAAVQIRADRLDARWAPRSRSLDEDPEVLRSRLEAVVTLAGACGCSPRLGI